jgi:tetratricopeptide (TPR) repeat protein
MESDDLEISDDQSTDTGTFFNKYKPREAPEREASNKFFRKYVLAQDGQNGDIDPQSEPDEPRPETEDDYSVSNVHQHKTRRTSTFFKLGLLPGLIGVAVLSGVLYSSNRRSLPPDESAPATIEETAQSDILSVEAQSHNLIAGAISARRARPRPAEPQRLNRALLQSNMLARAQELEARGMLGEAAKMYQSILNEFPGEQSSQDALNRIQNSFTARQRDEQVRATREAGLRKFRMGDYSGAETDLLFAVNSGRNDTATLYALGMSHLRLSNHSKAMAILNSCIAANPDYAPALVGLAQAQMFTGDKDQALSLLNRALQLGGGAEFTPVKIGEMISSIEASGSTPAKQSRNYFFAYAVHWHSSSLAWCRGELTINYSVVEFKSNNPAHSFRVSTAAELKAGRTGDELRLDVNGKPYSFTLEAKSVQEFLAALNP